MFKRLFKKQKPRVFLGVVAVAPRSDIKRHFDQWNVFGSEDLDASLRQNLSEIFSLPAAKDVQEPHNNDLVLDVVVPKFQAGEAVSVDFGVIGFPILWRPKITISSRLYYLKSKKTKTTFSVTEKMRWREFFGRALSWRAIFRFRPLFDSEDMELLLYQASHKLVLKLQKSAR